MKAENFCYWLQGFFEITDPKIINSDQIEMIKKHLNLVFAHDIDPKMGDADHQKKLNQIHSDDGYKSVLIRC